MTSRMSFVSLLRLANSSSIGKETELSPNKKKETENKIEKKEIENKIKKKETESKQRLRSVLSVSVSSCGKFPRYQKSHLV